MSNMQSKTYQSVATPKKVLMVCPWDQTIGGVNYIVRQLSESLPSAGFEPVYFFPDYNYTHIFEKKNSWGLSSHYYKLPDLNIPKKNYLSLLIGLVLLPRTIFALSVFIKQQKIKLINCHYLMGQYFFLAVAAKILNIPFVISMHGADLPPLHQAKLYYQVILKLTLKLSSQVVSCSEAFSEEILSVYPAIQKKLLAISNGLNINEFNPTPTKENFPHPYILCVALQVEKKGIDHLLNAFAMIEKKFPTFHLLLAGYGPLLESNKRLAKTLAIADRVHFLGSIERDRIQSLYQGATLCVLPSKQEPFGIALLEASFYSKAIVASRVGGIPKIIQDGVTGLLFESEKFIHRTDFSSKLNCIVSVKSHLELSVFFTLS